MTPTAGTPLKVSLGGFEVSNLSFYVVVDVDVVTHADSP
jgi:hypothetical protein